MEGLHKLFANEIKFSECERNGGSTPWPIGLWRRKENGVTTQIRSRNHEYSAFVKELILTREHVRILGMGMGRCQASNPTRPVGRPPLIVFQILIPLKGPLICYSKLTHANTHLTFKYGICPTLIHSIKPYHSSSNIYPRAVSTSKVVTSTMH